MLNAKSVAMNIVQGINPEWIETNFGSEGELIEVLVEILNQFKSVREIEQADSINTTVRMNSGNGFDFKYSILRVYRN